MRIGVGILLCMATAATANEPGDTGPELNAVQLDMPSYSSPPQPWRDLSDATAPTPQQCADRIRQIREQSGQPVLDKRAADSEEGTLIWAVDKREGGCPVMVAKGDLDDIRPVPEGEEQPLLRPAGK